ncbi:hypothetical protein E2P81_ATG03225 [Venturia nashicola]|uniref:Uncharacterized protein n=1 Tax=Venturia nashicola TaxID=86259 RepID=A0A4Z1PEN7_9PEZI|nr:hypothetical protein E6O75_ATG03292 [Venturia nashicola]TLD36336.1 hypothetical protein E2P81_ATG03225 [Venturia nashicola]
MASPPVSFNFMPSGYAQFRSRGCVHGTGTKCVEWGKRPIAMVVYTMPATVLVVLRLGHQRPKLVADA